MNEFQILLDSIRIFDIKLFDEDFYELIFRLALNIGVAYSIIHFFYKPTRKNSEYVFTFMVLNPLIFFICHLFSKVDLSIGFAFGLFAVFSILRYRTTQIQVKEMTYMFIVIALGVINALATKKVSYTELIFTNLFIVGMTYFLEKYSSKNRIHTQIIRYEKIENVKPEKYAILLNDLEHRIGKSIDRFEITEIDYVRDVAFLRVFYLE